MNNQYDNIDDNSWIKLPRDFVRWQWYKDSKVSQVFLYLLLHAKTEDTKYRDFSIKRGEILISILTLSQQTGLSLQSVRTCLGKLHKAHEIEFKLIGRNRITTIVGFNRFQPIGLTEVEPKWIKLYTKITECEWFKQHDFFHLFCHIILNAELVNTSSYESVIQCVYPLSRLSIDTGLPKTSVTACLTRMKNMGIINYQKLQNYYIYKITIFNCDFFKILRYYDGF